MKERYYLCQPKYHDHFIFKSCYRKGSKANVDDCNSAIWRCSGVRYKVDKTANIRLADDYDLKGAKWYCR